MDGTRVQALQFRGYRIAAGHVGVPHQHYRPTDPMTPVGPASLLPTLPASFSADNYAYKMPNLCGKRHDCLAPLRPPHHPRLARQPKRPRHAADAAVLDALDGSWRGAPGQGRGERQDRQHEAAGAAHGGLI